MENNFNRFDEIEDTKLRVFNRTVQLMNLQEDFGPVVAEEYVSQFAEFERAQILIMVNYIKVKGAENVTREIIRSTEPTELETYVLSDDERVEAEVESRTRLSVV